MKRKRKKYPAEFKAKVALEAIKGDETVQQLANRFGVHPTMITRWKKELMENAPELFGKGAKRDKDIHPGPDRRALPPDWTAKGTAGFFSQKGRLLGTKERKAMVEPAYKGLSVRRQCELLGLSRSAYYYRPRPVDKETLEIMRLIDQQFLETPVYGKRRMKEYLETRGYRVGKHRVARLMRLMGLRAIYPRSKTSKAHPEHKVYPYLLRNLEITHPNQVWSSDTTYIPMPKGFMYLVSIMDLYSRKVLSWSLSNTMDAGFCVAALEKALQQYGSPETFNTDQGSQFTSDHFISTLKEHNIKISMDGRGRFRDNIFIFIERLWRSVKYECVYITECKEVKELRSALGKWFAWYNGDRQH